MGRPRKRAGDRLSKCSRGEGNIGYGEKKKAKML